MTIQPESLANQLIDELGVFVNSGKTPSEFEIARFKKDADKLKKVDQAKYAMLHGMIIACFEGEFKH